MRYIEARIIENRPLGSSYFYLRLGGCEALSQSKPGQFVMLRGDWGRDPLLPRPTSLLSASSDGRVGLLMRSVGQGTRLLERSLQGTRVSVLGPLGNGFPEPTASVTDLLVAGGVGMPPLFMQAEFASKAGVVERCEMLYGGKTSRDILFLPEMRSMGLTTHIATEDGSLGRRGRVTAALEARLEHFRALGTHPVRILACGPKPMLWAVAHIAARYSVECYLSLEEQMACGFGVCLGCAVPSRSRPYRYGCKDGPVFLATDLILPQEASSTPEGRHE